MNNLTIVLVKEKMLETCRRPLRANNDNYIKEQFLNSVFSFEKKLKAFRHTFESYPVVTRVTMSAV